MSAKQLADQCEMSQPTVYRRVEWLRRRLSADPSRKRRAARTASAPRCDAPEFSLALADVVLILLQGLEPLWGFAGTGRTGHRGPIHKNVGESLTWSP